MKSSIIAKSYLFFPLLILIGMIFNCEKYHTNKNFSQLYSQKIENQYIVRTYPEISPYEILMDYHIDAFLVYENTITGFAAKLHQQMIQLLSKDKRILSVSLDRTIYAASQTLPTGTKRINTLLNQTAKIDNKDERVAVGVAVLDTGIDLTHPDLYVKGAVNFTSSQSWDASDRNGHGTHVAGIIGALDNQKGVVGVAPGVSLYAVKVLADNGEGTFSWLIAGIDWITAKSKDIKAANISMVAQCDECIENSNDSTVLALQDAIHSATQKGIVIVAAAGNDSVDSHDYVPAAFGGKGEVQDIITVSAFADFDGEPGSKSNYTCEAETDDTFAGFSNHGQDIDILAPGVCIYSTINQQGYDTLSGTSMAAPHVTGAVALAVSAKTATSAQGIKSFLIKQADDTPCENNEICTDDPDSFHEPLLNVNFIFCTTNIECNDNDFCTIDTCIPSKGCQHSARSCNDNNVCTSEYCNSITQACEIVSIQKCDDGYACNGSEICDSKNGCITTTLPICGTHDGCCPIACSSHIDQDCKVMVDFFSSYNECTSEVTCY